ncbi:MAG TPA: zinc ABC transporter substrate-binding protein [Acetobacteraceae bacterium]|nr:zinc ABC transporter substrate-binding protein [Acetobacteraceae bacterium]
MTRLAVFAAIAALLLAPWPAQAADHRIAIVAAENFYGDVAAQIGGPDVTVHSILTNPDQDPHLFEASPSVGRDLSAARIVIYSGIDYDPWMPKLLHATHASGRQVIVVANLVGGKPGDNPHIWYEPATMPALAGRLAAELIADDPAHKAGYQQRLARFKESMQPVLKNVAALRHRLAGTPVIATEPVFGYIFAALGMDVRDMPFQIAVMNNTEPAASNVAAFENDLRNHRVRLMVYNSQASDPIAARMMRLARQSHVPVVGATETEPPGKTYQAWMLSELDAVDHALPP